MTVCENMSKMFDHLVAYGLNLPELLDTIWRLDRLDNSLVKRELSIEILVVAILSRGCWW